MFETDIYSFDKLSRSLKNGKLRYYLKEYVPIDGVGEIYYVIRIENDLFAKRQNREIKNITTDLDHAVELFDLLCKYCILPIMLQDVVCNYISQKES